MHDDPLLTGLSNALRAAVACFGTHAEGAGLAGLALCTDDGLSTLFVVAVTQGELQGDADPDLLYTPMEWSQEPADTAFAPLSVELQRRSDAATHLDSHVHTAFERLVEGLEQLRADGLADGVFLTAQSTDPSDLLEHLADQAIRRLNRPTSVRGWEAFLAKWA
jgi:hypothetical protein